MPPLYFCPVLVKVLSVGIFASDIYILADYSQLIVMELEAARLVKKIRAMTERSNKHKVLLYAGIDEHGLRARPSGILNFQITTHSHQGIVFYSEDTPLRHER